MSLTEWKNRVAEAEAELRCVIEEREEVERAIEAKANALQKHKDSVKKDKAALTKKLQALERDALELASRTESATKARDAAESDYHDAMNAYESLHDAVKKIKAAESAFASRPDLEKQLEIESLRWAEEEHSLRSVLQRHEEGYRTLRKEGKNKIAELEASLKELEDRLINERAARRAEGWEGGAETSSAMEAEDECARSSAQPDSTTTAHRVVIGREKGHVSEAQRGQVHMRQGSRGLLADQSREQQQCQSLARKRPNSVSPLRDRTNVL